MFTEHQAQVKTTRKLEFFSSCSLEQKGESKASGFDGRSHIPEHTGGTHREGNPREGTQWLSLSYDLMG